VALGSAALPLASMRTALAAAPVKVAFVYDSPIADAGWNYQHDLGRRELEKNLGDQVATKSIENVPESADSERVFRDLAKSGHKLIFGTTFGYMNYIVKAANDHPGTDFEHCTGYKTSKNLGVYSGRFYEGRHLTGIAAGTMTKSNILGYVAAFPIPVVLMEINAYIRGARSVNPKAELRVVWINSWYDPGKERAAATTLIAQGADVLTHHTNSTAVAQTAEEKGVWVCPYDSDQRRYAPTRQLTATMQIWGGYYTDRVRRLIAGSWTADNTWGGIGQGMVDIAPLSPQIPVDVRAKILQTKADIASGALSPFAGPVVDQDGRARVPAGQNMSDDALGQMNYYVEGVAGRLPKG
jgi:simple sugar transport system substrate-binding protein